MQIVAHEIGHNLGMYHDFGDGGTSDNRVSSKGESCTGVGGYMDYIPNPNKWSPCSVEDFTNYFNLVEPWCLTERKCLYMTNVLLLINIRHINL